MLATIFQKLAVSLLSLCVFILWFIDVATSRVLLKVYKKSAKIGSVVISVLFFSFLIYSYSTKTVAKVFEGYFNNLVQFVPTQEVAKVDYPILVGNSNPPYVNSKSFLVADKSNSRVLYSYNGTQKQPPASTAKLMTALVALDLYSLDETVTVPKMCTQIDSTKAWLPEGASFKVRDLIYSMLIGSAGDSACTLASGKLPYENFVSLMNRKASLIGLVNSHFSNPVGLDDTEGRNYSTVEDLYTLAKVVMQNPTIADAVKSSVYNLKSQDGLFTTGINSTNQLLREIPNTLGIKTGTTESAGEVLMYEYADGKKDLVIVVMGSKDRFADTKTLLNWALTSFSWK